MLMLHRSQGHPDNGDNSRYTAIPDKMSLKESLVSFATMSSTRSTLSRYSHESSSVFTPRSSTSSYTTYGSSDPPAPCLEDIPRLVKTPWEIDRSMRAAVPKGSRRSTTGRSLPERIFRELPDEIYRSIVQQVESNYFSDATGTCVKCYLRDLYHLSLTSQAWQRAARQQLYRKIWLASELRGGVADLPWHTIKLLRRTLRERPLLARLVKELHFPDSQIVYQESQMKQRQDIINTLASLVMATPNLERFHGLYLTYDHVFDRLTHALSTRTQLREKTWVLRRSDVGIDEEGVIWSNHDEYGQADNHDAFLKSHDNWRRLDTLCLFGQTTGRMDYRAFAATFRSLPSLKHLLISDFDATQFGDRTLSSILTPLASLRLQDVPGVTEKGLAKFFNSSAALSLQNLSLVKLEITSALLISKIMARCTNLKRFTLAQNISPALPVGIEPNDDDTPIYGSLSIEYIHWDIIAYGPSLQDLANSIAAHGFPELQELRAPSDDGGILQKLCAPQADWQTSTPRLDEEANPFSYFSLPDARREAQRRKREAAKDPFIKIVVSDEDGVVQHTYTLRTYMGQLESTIYYSLDPDVPGSEDFIAGLNDLLVSRVADTGSTERYCSDEFRNARGSFESGSSGNSGGSLRNLALGRRKTIGGKKSEVVGKAQGKGHKTRKIYPSPEMRVFF